MVLQACRSGVLPRLFLWQCLCRGGGGCGGVDSVRDGVLLVPSSPFLGLEWRCRRCRSPNFSVVMQRRVKVFKGVLPGPVLQRFVEQIIGGAAGAVHRGRGCVEVFPASPMAGFNNVLGSRVCLQTLSL